MRTIKSEPPSPSRTGEDEEVEGYDLYTPDTLEANGPSTSPTQLQSHYRKRPSTASDANPSGKRQCSATSRKQTSQSKTQSKAQPNAQPNAQPRSKPHTKTPVLVMCIDFGTTYSGLAYFLSVSSKREVKPFTRWFKTKDHVKTPSAIKIGLHDIWGIDAELLPDALRWFKLLLVDPQDLDEDVRTSEQLQQARLALEASGMSAVGVVSIFLKRMFEHAVEKLKVEMGAGTVDTSRFHVVFTVPAIWPESARRRMKQAVDRSGILKARQIGETTCDYISEPEAAALATLADFGGIPNAGDTIVVVDCGGGTVDIITYKIIKTKPMTVQEVVAGNGALCGAIFVEERFRDLVVKKLKEKTEDAMDIVSPKEMQDIMAHWETIRDDFNGEAKTWEIRQPLSLIIRGPLDPNGGYPTITFTSDEVEEVFRPIVEKIKNLVDSQIGATVKKAGDIPTYATLVGGFGTSGYLREYLMRHCPEVEVLQSSGWAPWSAICRGGVIHGMTKKKLGTPLRVEVASRIARQSYGTICEERFNEEVHPEEDKIFDHILREDVAIKVMKWHVKRGDEVPANHTTSIPLTKHLEELPEKIIINIYTSVDDEPSNRKDESVTKVAEITWVVRVDWDSLETFENDLGKSFNTLDYNVEMKRSAGATAFSIYHRGRKQASKNVALKFYD